MKKKNRYGYNEQDERSFWDDVVDFVKVFVITGVVVFLFVQLIATPVQVDGHSMVPTLLDKEFGFTSRVANFYRPVQRFDVVVISMNEKGKTSNWVKRIIGMPKDTIECRDDVIYINGKAIDESSYLDKNYVKTMKERYGYFTSDFGPVTLKEDEYFVMGDNRPISKDSRYSDVGPVKKSQIYGQGVLVLWPLNQIKVH